MAQRKKTVGALPMDFGDYRSVHRTMQTWNRLGVMERIWTVLIEQCEELGSVDWQWQSADAAMGKARWGGDQVGPNPTDRGKNGSKRSVIVEADGGPLGIVLAPANVHDAKLLEATIESIVIESPEPTDDDPQNLCLDKGYDNPTGRAAASSDGHTPHIRRIGEEKLDDKKRKRRQLVAGWSNERWRG